MNTNAVGYCRTIVLEGLQLTARLGIRDGEADTPQPIIIDARLEVRKGPPSGPDALVANWVAEPRLREVVCCDTLAARIQGIAASRVWLLTEELAESLVALCLADSRVIRVVVRVSKPRAIPDAKSASIEIVAQRRDAMPE